MFGVQEAARTGDTSTCGILIAAEDESDRSAPNRPLTSVLPCFLERVLLVTQQFSRAGASTFGYEISIVCNLANLSRNPKVGPRMLLSLDILEKNYEWRHRPVLRSSPKSLR